MASAPIRLAILEADIPIGDVQTKYGSYGGVFTSLLHRACDASSIPRDRLQTTGWDVINADNAPEGQKEDMGGDWKWIRRKGYPKLEEIDAVLITGSRMWVAFAPPLKNEEEILVIAIYSEECKETVRVIANGLQCVLGHNAFDDDPWILRLVEYTQHILSQQRVKVIGVCYGHQIVGRALGAKVARSESGAWEVSVCQVKQTPKGKELFGGKDVLNILQMHKDLVYYYPQGVEELGSSDVCKVQGMYVEERVLTVQGHPEFTEDIERQLLENRRRLGIFGDDMYEEAMARVGKEHDGVLVGQAFLKFLGADT